VVARVLITGFCAVPAPRRSGVQLRHVVRALSPAHTVDVLVVREGDQGYVERQGGVRILRVPTPDGGPPSQIQAFQRALKRQLEGADYDVVHCRDGWSALPVLEARDRLGYAVVFDMTRADEPGVHDAAVDERKRDEDMCLAAADLVLVPTEIARRHAVERARPDRVVLAPPGVDVDRFDWDDAPPGPPRVLYVGAIAPGRGVRVLLRAMRDVLAAIDGRLVLAGPIAPGFAPVMRAGIAELGLTDRVDLLGPVDHDEVPALIATAAVCVAPAAADLAVRPTALYPTKILEYMACRRAVIAARRSTAAMLVEHGRDGLLFAPGDPEDLAAKLLRVLGDRPLRERLAAAGYDRVRRELTASGARRGVRTAYALLSSHPAWPQRADSRPGAGRRRATTGGDAGLPDDDFEATVFEELPVSPPASRDGSDSDVSSLDAALAALDASRGGVHTEERIAPSHGEDTQIKPERRGQRGWRTPGDDWVIASLHELARAPTASLALRRHDSEDDGTPLDVMPVSPLAVEPHDFLAGEIDVPSREVDAGAFTAASPLLGNRGDDDTSD
jgi:glycosyltransferase involved in cell wall biosynthesis